MPPKKRCRTAPQNEDAPARSIAATSFKLYNALPAEIRQIVIQAACLASSSSSEPTSSSSSYGLYDITTALGLSLVCRETHRLALPALWACITITRPSSLYALHQTLLAKPDRAQLIRSLHIGPQDILPPQWAPLSQGRVHDQGSKTGAPPPPTWILSSLRKMQLPSGFEEFQALPLDRRPSGCRDSAIHEALNVAQRSLNVTLVDEEGVLNVGTSYEIQAVLDLYLQKIKALEEENPDLLRLAREGARVPLRCRSGHCDHYPVLAVTDIPSSSRGGRLDRREPQPNPPRTAFTVTYSQLLRHLARPGSVGDRFDHISIFSRSGISADVSIPSETMRACEGYRGAGYQLTPEGRSVHEQREEKPWRLLAHLRQEDQALASAGGEPLNAALISTATISANLRLARAVLALTTKLSSLSLTGFLERALDGLQTTAPLRRVSLGPPPCGWITELCLSGLDHVEELRICGVALTATETYALSKLTRLRVLEWTMADQLSTSLQLPRTAVYGSRITDAVRTVRDLTRVHDHNSSSLTSEASGPAAAAQESGHVSEAEQADPSLKGALVIARLQPRDVGRILAAAPSAEIEEAWQQGRRVTGMTQSRRLLLLERREAGQFDVREQPSVDSTSRWWEKMYEEGRQWRRGVGELREGGPLRGEL